jgi:hypothetical protein
MKNHLLHEAFRSSNFLIPTESIIRSELIQELEKDLSYENLPLAVKQELTARLYAVRAYDQIKKAT